MCLSPSREGLEEPELVQAAEANVKIPQMVIGFYESKLTWHDEGSLLLLRSRAFVTITLAPSYSNY